ncbi:MULTISPECIES: NAD(+) kinase [unclassified Shewanella]|uniref:NAD(+) kinase n=1 Tax=unclassified Shewanella TaxID=196818 RepID=UPI000C82980B|nr:MULTISPECIES: NAD(+) kinase [unclassified Shewanella]MDO6618647.1 NAD(+) kinase [Shewanella sp. 6_MG-2023]MDO6641150.1 NAD(+) kinase [Shewanella sp. 5_MG-2023]MDO6678562.1 NAD(+) kinase [Shewanella sp. 4_MG-2023]MDO6774696.1 NAD(+) kinase [Shewanella sp. 3_MG-2023]PMG31990.1 NAD(+) kinase [Shewanella sp. 10N.286.52.C2]
MTKKFQTIGLIGKPHHQGTNRTLKRLHHWLSMQGFDILAEERVASELKVEVESVDLTELGERCDLAIVVGGDGNMLGAARVLSRFDIGVIGVNRGNLGFLTDLPPDNFEESLSKVLEGEYDTENRFLLEAEVHRHGILKASNSAVNEAVLHPGKVAHMIQFEVYIDEQFMYSQRADGMIVSTPTGSTAYALSAGGSILTPNLQALILVPMFPHTLSSRPIVVDACSTIKLVVSPDNGENLEVSCDGHVDLAVLPGDEIFIRRSNNHLRMIHPKGHNYFDVLRAKLGWGSKLF